MKNKERKRRRKERLGKKERNKTKIMIIKKGKEEET